MKKDKTIVPEVPEANLKMKLYFRSTPMVAKDIRPRKILIDVLNFCRYDPAVVTHSTTPFQQSLAYPALLQWEKDRPQYVIGKNSVEVNWDTANANTAKYFVRRLHQKFSADGVALCYFSNSEKKVVITFAKSSFVERDNEEEWINDTYAV